MSCFKAHYYFSCSSFNDHLGYKLSKGEVDNILKRKLKYKWELPAFDMLNCKWIGTGERLQKVCLPPIVHYNVLYYNPFIPSCIYLLPSIIAYGIQVKLMTRHLYCLCFLMLFFYEFQSYWANLPIVCLGACELGVLNASFSSPGEVGD